MDNDAQQVHSSSDFEVESQDLHLQAKLKTLRLLDGVRVGITAVALLAAITILGVSGDALAVFDSTHVPSEYRLALWPDHFDLRPTVALVVGSAIIVVSNILALFSSKVRMLRDRPAVHTPVMFAAPLIGFIVAIVAMGYFYNVNASVTVDTLQSWSCRWSDVHMVSRPHFSTLCKESQAGLYLSILLIPIEAIALAVSGYQFVVERQVSTMAHGSRRASPMLKKERSGAAY